MLAAPTPWSAKGGLILDLYGNPVAVCADPRNADFILEQFREIVRLGEELENQKCMYEDLCYKTGYDNQPKAH